jgi:cation diffusion facilitator family transporter
MAHGSKKAVYAALVGNLAIAITKFIAAVVGNSSAMLAEAYHSLSDVGNQILLLIGIKRSKRQPDKRHPFGYGKVQFFYAFIVAMLLFGVAGVLSVREGIHKITQPEPLQNVTLIFSCLALAAVFEGFALRVAYQNLRQQMHLDRTRSVFRAIKDSKDPTILVVIFEDALALLSIIVATFSISLSYLLSNPFYDALGSLIIGALLMVFSIVLAYEIKKLLIGESISERRRAELIEAIFEIEEVKEIIDLRAMHLGPEEVMITAEVNLKHGLHTAKIEEIVDRIEKRIKKIFPKVLCYIETEEDKDGKKFGAKRLKTPRI